MKDAIFILVAVFAVGGALLTAASQSIINAALGLLLSLISIAALYIFQSADFVAISQILVYVGGVMVLLLFSIMLSSGSTDFFKNNPAMKVFPALLIVVVFAGLAIYALFSANLTFYPGQYGPSTREIGNLFLKDYILVFELVSVLIVVMLVGAGVMLRKELVRKAVASDGDSKDEKENKK
ncbi:MAG: NADH-quinone oxidoreductase subunit J [Spirochaetia bacterium]|nr:NADH-quinone oxidoreductase subunit J [Spirochaetia bacterium]